MPNSFDGVLANIPFMGGVLASQRYNEDTQQRGLQNQLGNLGLLAQIQAQQQAAQLRNALANGDTGTIAKLPGGIDILNKMATIQNTGITGQLHSAQLQDIQRKAAVANEEQAYRRALIPQLTQSQFKGENANNGAPTALELNDAAAIERLRAVEEENVRRKAQGLPEVQANFDVNNPNVTRALVAGAGNSIPARTASDILRNVTPAPMTTIGSNYRPVAGGYLERQPDGSAKFVPTSTQRGAGAPNTPNSAAPISGDFNLSGDEFLASIPEQDRNFVKKLANYDIDPKTLSTRGGEREKYLRLASQYSPEFDQKNYNAIAGAINRFATGQQGNTVRSLNVAIDHMDTARKLGDALKNSDIPLFNRLANEIATQTGHPAPTNFNAVKEIVADEVVKGVIGGAGALADREAAAKKIRDASSPEQMKGVLDSWTELLGGQIKGLERQYEGATRRKDFREKYLTPRTIEAIGGVIPSSSVTTQKSPVDALLEKYK